MSCNPLKTFYRPRENNSFKRTCHNSLKEDVENLFSKKFEILKNSDWSLPNSQSWFKSLSWSHTNLENLKSKLNFHKSQLNDFNIEKWSAHTRRRNPAGDVGWKIRNIINPEFLTQAWTKFYECAHNYRIVPQEAQNSHEMVSLHLCEAPGAFIASLNHYLKLHHSNINWLWMASTLNPYYEGNSPSDMISDDRFMFHTLRNWDFGADNTGNLMDWDNSQQIIKNSKSLGKVLLVTADGSIDCLLKPDAQEQVTSHLHYCETVTALLALDRGMVDIWFSDCATGGNFVVKLFTIFENTTICLLYLLSNLFESVNIYKPVTSKCGNSEVYAVCMNYSGSSQLEPSVDVLKLGFDSVIYDQFSLFSNADIPSDFLNQIEECSQFFCAIQCQVINNNLQAFLIQNHSSFKETKRVRAIIAAEFMSRYELRPIPFHHEILKGLLLEQVKLNKNPRQHKGSFTERQLYDAMSVKEKFQNLNHSLDLTATLDSTLFLTDNIQWWTFYDPNDSLKLDCIWGKPLKRIESSQFIYTPLFKLYGRIQNELELNKIMMPTPAPKDDWMSEIYECPNKKVIKFADTGIDDDYNVEAKKTFEIILKEIKQVKDETILILENFNLVTHLNVGVLTVLSKYLFKTAGFTNSGVIILKNVVKAACVDCLSEVQYEWDQQSTKCLLSILPRSLTNSGHIYDAVFRYNNTFYRQKSKVHLSSYKLF